MFTQKKVLIFAAFALCPLIDIMTFTVANIIPLINADKPKQDSELSVYLVATYILPFPNASRSHYLPHEVTLSTWERSVAPIIIASMIYLQLLGTMIQQTVLCGGLAMREINSKMLKMMKDDPNSNLTYDFLEHHKRNYHIVIHRVTKLWTTIYVVLVYARLSIELVSVSNYPRMKWATSIVKTLAMMVVLLVNAEASAMVLFCMLPFWLLSTKTIS